MRSFILFSLTTTLLLSGCNLIGGKTANKLTGGVSIAHEKSVTIPAHLPAKVYVQDFSLNVSDLKTDSGIGGVTDQVAGSSGILGRVSQRASRGAISGTAEAQTPEIISAMSQSLLAAFRKQGVPVDRFSGGEKKAPADGWLVKGRFVDIDEGNRLQRAAVGFGMGATQMDVEVEVSDLSGKNEGQPFLVFGTTKEAGMKPGGFNPYVIAAKFHMEKKATVTDIQNTADQIVAEILKNSEKKHE